jgi:proton glutamate symport protein
MNKKPNLLFQILIAATLGVAVGYFFPGISSHFGLLGSLFMNLIQVLVVPLIFPLIVLSVLEIGAEKELGKIVTKSIGYFFAVTTFLITLTLLFGKWVNVGGNVQLGEISTESLDGIATGIKLEDFFLSIIPSNIIQALADGSLLPIIFFAIFLGIGLLAIGDEAKPVVQFFTSWKTAIFKLVDYAIQFAPIGVFGFLAYDVATYGVSGLSSLLSFVFWLYIAYLTAAFIIYPIIALIFKVSYFELLKSISDLVIIAFTTGGSSVVLPSLIDRLEENGVPKSISSGVTCFGYTLNLGGAAIYVSFAIAFIINIYDATLSVSDILVLVLFLTFITKSIATVPSGAIVVLLATATQLGLPSEAVALLVSIDFFANAGRTALNVVGNALAPAIIAKTEETKLLEFEKINEKEGATI